MRIGDDGSHGGQKIGIENGPGGALKGVDVALQAELGIEDRPPHLHEGKDEGHEKGDQGKDKDGINDAAGRKPLSRSKLFDLWLSPGRLDEVALGKIIPLGHQRSHGDEDEEYGKGVSHARMLAHLAGKFNVGFDHQIRCLLGDHHGHAEVFDGRHESQDGPGKDRGKDQR